MEHHYLRNTPETVSIVNWLATITAGLVNITNQNKDDGKIIVENLEGVK